MAVADLKDDAPGLVLAKQKGLFTTNDYNDLLSRDDIDLIIELTGETEIIYDILDKKDKHVRIISERTAQLFWEIARISAMQKKTSQELYETNALKTVFQEDAHSIPVSSTKSMTGHLLGAAGGIEAAFTALALKKGIVPPTINLDNPGDGCDLDYVPHTARKTDVHAAMTNSFGFGGTNASLVLKRVDT